MKITKNDVETMHYLRNKGFTQEAISTLLGCHRTLVEYYTTPGRMDYVKDYARGRYYKQRINVLHPLEVAKIVK